MSDMPRGSSPAPSWRPLGYQERRVLGVLIEKAKTTPDVYPLTINGLVSGCSQKSNRDPVFTIEPEQVEDSLEKLRQYGVVAEVQGTGRVPKYRHYAYDWFGVEKVELGVMCELLVRGEQTEGELRGRVSRMDPINDLPTLRTILNGLKAKGLVVSLTSQGRGHVVAHCLYSPQELEKLKAKYASQAGEPYDDEPSGGPSGHAPSSSSMHATSPSSASPSSAARSSGATLSTPSSVASAPATAAHATSGPAPATFDAGPRVDPAEFASLRQEMTALRQETVVLRQEVTAAREELARLKVEYTLLAARLESTEAGFKQLREALGG